MKNKKLEENIDNIINWATDRDFFAPDGVTLEKQQDKLAEEFGELMHAYNRGDKVRIKDAIGDMFVVIIILAKLNGYTTEEIKYDIDFEMYPNNVAKPIEFSFHLINTHHDVKFSVLQRICNFLKIDISECVQQAYNAIKDRKGKIINNTYIKEEDL